MKKRRPQDEEKWNARSILAGCALSIFLWLISAGVLSGQIMDFRLTIQKSNTILAALNIPIILLGTILAAQKVKPIIASVSISFGYIIMQWFFAAVVLGGKMQHIEQMIISILIGNVIAVIIIYHKKIKKHKRKKIYR